MCCESALIEMCIQIVQPSTRLRLTVTGPIYTDQKNFIEGIWRFDKKTSNQLAYICGRVHHVDDDGSKMWADIYVEYKHWQNVDTIDDYFDDDTWEVDRAVRAPALEAAATTKNQQQLGGWKRYGVREDLVDNQ